MLELCSLEDVVANPVMAKGVNTEHQDWLVRQIRLASAMIEARAEREFATEERTRVFEIDHVRKYFLRLPAFGSGTGTITTVWADLYGTFNATTVVSDGYVYESRTGVLSRLYLPWPRGPRAVQVKWTDGVAASTDKVPDDLREMCARQVVFWYQQRANVGVQSKTMLDSRSVTTLGPQKLLDEIAEHIDRRYRLEPGVG